MTSQIFAFWRLALDRHDDGISATFGGSVHTYQVRWRNTVADMVYTDHLGRDILAGRIVQLTKSERNNR
jgi:hypothetical protein